MEWKKAVESGERTFSIPERWLHLHYYEALNTLFRFENALRIFVYAILKNELQEKWLQLSITSDDAEQSTIDSIARKRRSQAGKFGYLGYSINCPVMHLTSGELIGIITSDSYWKHFARFFPGSKEIIRNKLEEIGVIRNALAHFRPLKEDDVEVVKQNAKQTLVLIEKYLSEMLHCNYIIPTNTEDSWYKELSTIGNEYCSIQLHQSKDEHWVKISLAYTSPIIQKSTPFSGWRDFVVLNVISPAIIKKHQDLANLATCCLEQIRGHAKSIDVDPEIKKTVSLVMHKTLVEKQHKIMRSVIEQVLQKIAAETELIRTDHLAKGDIVENAKVAMYLKGEEKKFIVLNRDSLKCDVRENDPVEYWGNLGYIPSDFVSAAHQYPWMPVPISSGDDTPF